MKAKITEQSHRITLKITEARVSLLRQISPSEVDLQISFIATHYCKKEIQVIDEVATEVEVCVPFQGDIIYDTITQVVPFDLWIGIVKSAESPEMIPSINAALANFNQLFVNSMSGFTLQIENVTMG